MKKIMFFRPLYSLGGTEIAMLNLVTKLKGYKIYIGYSDETSDQHLLDRFTKFAEVVNLNEIESIDVDTFITCSAHYNLVEAVKKVHAEKTLLWIHHLVNVETTVLADKEETDKLDSIVTVSNTTAKTLKEVFPNLTLATYSALISSKGNQLINSQYDFVVLDELHRTGAPKWYESLENGLDEIVGERGKECPRQRPGQNTPKRPTERRLHGEQTVKICQMK